MSIFLVSPSFGINSCTAEHSEHSHCEIETTDVHTVTSSPEPFAIDSPLWFHTSLHTNEGSVPSTFSSCAVSYTVIVPDVTLAKIFHRETSNINDSLENLAQHIFMSPGSAYSLLPETNGLKVKSRTERWRLNTGLQILKSKVLGVYAYTYPLHLKVVLLLLFWGQKKKNWRHINNNSASHLGSKSVNSKWQWASCCMMCALGFVCVARVGISKGQTNSAEVHGHS